METKESLRNIVKKQRATLTEAEVIHKSKCICSKLIKLYSDYDNFLVYSSINNEINLDYFVFEARQLGKNIAYPRVKDTRMDFYITESDDDLEEGYFHIKEPKKNCKIFYPDNKTICFVPGLVFSTEGDRIGYGKGFYDSYFNSRCFTKTDEIYLNCNIKKVGIMYDFQLVSGWKTNEFDVKMDALITEKREVYFDDEIRRNL